MFKDYLNALNGFDNIFLFKIKLNKFEFYNLL